MIQNFKEVYFHEYCHRCQHEEKPENEEPCDECMSRFFQWASHKPAYFKEKEKKEN